MRQRRRFAALLPAALLAACQTRPAPPPTPASGPAVVPAVALPAPGPASETGWRGIILDVDLDRLDRLGVAWTEGLTMARGAGFARQIGAEGALLAPDAAQPRAALPPGSYRCRLIRLGAGSGPHAYTAFQPFFCHVAVDGTELAFTKQTGSERPGGYMWTDGDRRMVFLGANAVGAEPAPPPYGASDSRNVAGVAERVGPLRYRLVVPWPRNGARLDVIELIPYVPPTD